MTRPQTPHFDINLTSLPQKKTPAGAKETPTGENLDNNHTYTDNTTGTAT